MYLRKPQAERQNEGLQDEKIYMLEIVYSSILVENLKN